MPSSIAVIKVASMTDKNRKGGACIRNKMISTKCPATNGETKAITHTKMYTHKILLRATRRCSPLFVPLPRLLCKTVSTEINVTIVVNTKYAYDIMGPIKGVTASVL